MNARYLRDFCDYAIAHSVELSGEKSDVPEIAIRMTGGTLDCFALTANTGIGLVSSVLMPMRASIPTLEKLTKLGPEFVGKSPASVATTVALSKELSEERDRSERFRKDRHNLAETLQKTRDDLSLAKQVIEAQAEKIALLEKRLAR